MKKILSILLAAATLSACQETMDERCAREAKDFTEKKCPALISATNGTRVVIDSLVFTPQNRTLTYYYTVEGTADDTLAIQKADLWSQMLKELRNSANLKDYKEAGYNFGYVYYSTKNAGTRLFEATFQRKDYQ